MAYGLLIFAAIAVGFMSSLFTNLSGLRTAFVEAFTVWRTSTGASGSISPGFST